MQRRAGACQQFATTSELEQVVGSAPVGGAASPRHDAVGSQPTEVIGDEVLWQLQPRAQFADAAVAARKLAQQSPPDRMPG